MYGGWCKPRLTQAPTQAPSEFRAFGRHNPASIPQQRPGHAGLFLSRAAASCGLEQSACASCRERREEDQIQQDITGNTTTNIRRRTRPKHKATIIKKQWEGLMTMQRPQSLFHQPERHRQLASRGPSPRCFGAAATPENADPPSFHQAVNVTLITSKTRSESGISPHY